MVLLGNKHNHKPVFHMGYLAFVSVDFLLWFFKKYVYLIPMGWEVEMFLSWSY